MAEKMIKRKLEMEADLDSGYTTLYDIEEKKLAQTTFVILGVNGTARMTCDIRGCTEPAYGSIGPECASTKNLVGCQSHSEQFFCLCEFDLKNTNNSCTRGDKLVCKINHNGKCTKYSCEKRRFWTRYVIDKSSITKPKDGLEKLKENVSTMNETVRFFRTS